MFVFVAPEIGTEVEGDDIFGEGGVWDYGVVLSFGDGCAGGGGEEGTEGAVGDCLAEDKLDV